jgi:hypothetical protein
MNGTRRVAGWAAIWMTLCMACASSASAAVDGWHGVVVVREADGSGQADATFTTPSAGPSRVDFTKSVTNDTGPIACGEDIETADGDYHGQIPTTGISTTAPDIVVDVGPGTGASIRPPEFYYTDHQTYYTCDTSAAPPPGARTLQHNDPDVVAGYQYAIHDVYDGSGFLHGTVPCSACSNTVAGDTTGSFTYALTQGADRDGDGFPDDRDACPDQFATPYSMNGCPGQAACGDHLDNDGDGKTDWPADLGCASALDIDETDQPDEPNPAGKVVLAEHLITTIKNRTKAPDADAAAAAAGFQFIDRATGQQVGFLHDGQQTTVAASSGLLSVQQSPGAPFEWALSDITCDRDGWSAVADLRITNITISGSAPIRCTYSNRPDLWDPLVKAAGEQTLAIQAGHDGTRGYFGQIVNIVCAASHSARGICDAMAAQTNHSRDPWAGSGYSLLATDTQCNSFEASCWVFNVFNSYLGGDLHKITKDARTIEADASKTVKRICQEVLPTPADLGCGPLAHTTEAQAVYAGAIHFSVDLDPHFRSFTADVVEEAAAKSPADVVSAIGTIDGEHEALLRNAVEPGFDLSYTTGALTKFGQRAAKASIPFAAVCLRESAIHDALIAHYGDRGATYYERWSNQGDRTWYHSSACHLLLAAVPLAGLARPKIAHAATGIIVTQQLPGPGTLTATVTKASTSAKRATALGGHTLATTRRTVTRKGTVSLSLHLTRYGRTQMRAHRQHMRVHLRIAFSPSSTGRTEQTTTITTLRTRS